MLRYKKTALICPFDPSSRIFTYDDPRNTCAMLEFMLDM